MPTPPPLVLIPPSEGKTSGGDGPAWRPGTMADAALDAARAQVATAARAAGALARGAPTTPALDRYDGVLYRELDWPGLPVAARRRGASQVRIVSGLWGLVAPTDPIPRYSLKMSASLPDLGRLATWWRPQLSPLLAELARGRVVWDLLPKEHAAACDWADARPARRVTIRFVDPRGRTVSHWNKLLKGAVVRWILTESPEGPEALADFEHPAGYALDPTASRLDGERAEVVMRAG